MLIAEREPESEPVTTEGITRIGFIQLQAQMIVMERVDLVWRMLFMFGYDRTLSLSPQLFASIPVHDSSPVRICQRTLRAPAMCSPVLRL